MCPFHVGLTKSTTVQHRCFFNYCRTTEVLPGSKPGIQSCRCLDSASGDASCTTAAGCGWPAGWTRCPVWASSCRGEDDSFLLMREKTDTVYRSHALGKKITTFSKLKKKKSPEEKLPPRKAFWGRGNSLGGSPNRETWQQVEGQSVKWTQVVSWGFRIAVIEHSLSRARRNSNWELTPCGAIPSAPIVPPIKGMESPCREDVCVKAVGDSCSLLRVLPRGIGFRDVWRPRPGTTEKNVVVERLNAIFFFFLHNNNFN